MPKSEDAIVIAPHLLPIDGRFGAGPSKIRDAQMQVLGRAGHTLMGTSHRQAPVQALVSKIREGLRDLFSLPEGYEVALGNGGSTAFWDIAALSLVRERSQHAVCGEFSAKFAAACARAPFLAEPQIQRVQAGDAASLTPTGDVDTYALTHNETSTGVMTPIVRPPSTHDQIVVVDATSAAGALPIDVRESDLYFFAPQKTFGSDGGLWIALASPAAIDRAHEIESSGRYIPEFLSLRTALDHSRNNQTLNTPAIATLVLLAEQIEWLNARGGLEWAISRCEETSGLVHEWVTADPRLEFFVREPHHRSTVVTTIDVDTAIDAAALCRVLRRHGIVDIEPYRKLGRNQLRIATFPAIEPADVRALIDTITFVLDALA